jgi:hypothetical protein
VKFQSLGAALCHRQVVLLLAHNSLFAGALWQRGRPFSTLR